MYINQSKTHGRPGQASGSHLAVPQGLDIIGADRSNISQLSHHKVTSSDGVSYINAIGICQDIIMMVVLWQPVYFSKLLDVFEGMPRLADQSDVDMSSLITQSAADKIESAVEEGDEVWCLAILFPPIEFTFLTGVCAGGLDCYGGSNCNCYFSQFI